MEERKTIFDYLAQALTVFGFAMAVLNVFCLLFGESAKEVSAMFALGRKGIPAEIVFQFAAVSVLITVFRFVFFTDVFIRNMKVWLRAVCMLALVVMTIAVFAVTFQWFPANLWQPWAMFFLCFGLSVSGSYGVMSVKEKTENRRLEDALKRLKSKEGRQNEQ
ncbi:hypothetical protein VSQ32_08625 [Lachnospiraceae bacterium KK002]